MATAIEQWLDQMGFTCEEERSKTERGFGHESGAFLTLNSGQDESPFWALYCPPGDGEQPDESGNWDETPDWTPSKS
jgi:hypothetical protein